MARKIRPEPAALPCPFCGWGAESELWHGGGPRKTMVRCANEYCNAAPCVTGGTRGVALRRWNTRNGETPNG